jgi:hypothetical protein
MCLALASLGKLDKPLAMLHVSLQRAFIFEMVSLTYHNTYGFGFMFRRHSRTAMQCRW